MATLLSKALEQDEATLEDGYCMEIRHNVRSYYNTVVRIGDMDIIVTTLWSSIPLREAYYTEQVVTDFRRILYKGEPLAFADFNREHQRCLAFVKDAVATSDAKVKIVVSHHVPSFRLLHPRFADSLCNGAFTVELQDFIIDSDIDFWIYGHSHYNIDMKIGKTLCTSNQLGYVHHNEHSTFDRGKMIDTNSAISFENICLRDYLKTASLLIIHEL